MLSSWYHKYPIPTLVLAFFLLRGGSWLLRDSFLIQNILGVFLLITLVAVFWKNRVWAARLVAIDLLLGGAGGLFSSFSLSWRTGIIVVYLACYLGECLWRRREQLKLPRPLLFGLATLTVIILTGVLNGLRLGNPLSFVIQDALPFIFAGLIFPVREYLAKAEERKFWWHLILAFVLGSALWSLLALGIFSSGLAEIHGDFYKWWRDIAGGKITDMGNGFFRIVLPEHLLIVPILFLLLAQYKDKLLSQLPLLLIVASSTILMLNFSRAYLLSLAVGLLLLKVTRSWKSWFFTGLLVTISCLVVFFATSLVASRGTSLGLELLGLRTASFVRPQIELSTHTRTELLAPIWAQIQRHPILGSGLGGSVSFVSPSTGELVQTRQFDWGYLEIWTELGMTGLLWYIVLLFSLLYSGYRLARNKTPGVRGEVTLLTTASILVVAIFAPVLVHVLGVVLVVGMVGGLEDDRKKKL